ncbi:MAG TPA: hypothetical protein VGJ21_02590 [Terracidiphilus sp.]|jgi:hypothetical protein
MQTTAHPLEPFFLHEVTSTFDGKLGLNDPEISGYISRVLCHFSEGENLIVKDGRNGHTLEQLVTIMRNSDPVNGTALSFDAERAMRKYVGDYCLFVAGMVPEAIETGDDHGSSRPTLGDLIRAGKESYYVVSQFNVFEYRREAPLFGRLSEQFERYVLGLALVREELGRRMAKSRV